MKIKEFDYLPDDSKIIRKKVFEEEQGFRDEFDETDRTAIHIVMYDGEKAVATCRIYRAEESDTYIVGRVAVLKELRGHGLGSRLVRGIEPVVSELGGREIILHSQCTAVDFYRKLGYTEYGEIELEESCPHIWMKKQIGEKT